MNLHHIRNFGPLPEHSVGSGSQLPARFSKPQHCGSRFTVHNTSQCCIQSTFGAVTHRSLHVCAMNGRTATSPRLKDGVGSPARTDVTENGLSNNALAMVRKGSRQRTKSMKDEADNSFPAARVHKLCEAPQSAIEPEHFSNDEAFQADSDTLKDAPAARPKQHPRSPANKDCSQSPQPLPAAAQSDLSQASPDAVDAPRPGPDNPGVGDDLTQRVQHTPYSTYRSEGSSSRRAVKGRKEKQDPSYRETVSRRLAKRGERIRALWQDPAYRLRESQRRSASMLLIWQDPVRREKLLVAIRQDSNSKAERMRQLWQDPSFRERHRQGRERQRQGRETRLSAAPTAESAHSATLVQNATSATGSNSADAATSVHNTMSAPPVTSAQHATSAHNATSAPGAITALSEQASTLAQPTSRSPRKGAKGEKSTSRTSTQTRHTALPAPASQNPPQQLQDRAMKVIATQIITSAWTEQRLSELDALLRSAGLVPRGCASHPEVEALRQMLLQARAALQRPGVLAVRSSLLRSGMPQSAPDLLPPLPASHLAASFNGWLPRPASSWGTSEPHVFDSSPSGTEPQVFDSSPPGTEAHVFDSSPSGREPHVFDSSPSGTDEIDSHSPSAGGGLSATTINSSTRTAARRQTAVRQTDSSRQQAAVRQQSPGAVRESQTTAEAKAEAIVTPARAAGAASRPERTTAPRQRRARGPAASSPSSLPPPRRVDNYSGCSSSVGTEGYASIIRQLQSQAAALQLQAASGHRNGQQDRPRREAGAAKAPEPPALVASLRATARQLAPDEEEQVDTPVLGSRTARARIWADVMSGKRREQQRPHSVKARRPRKAKQSSRS